MNYVPANISIATARLPQAYENAKNALADCANIDECMDWADKAAALASYAKQADDDQLEKMAMRIRARAIRRCGELLKQFDGRGRPSENTVGDHGNYSQAKAARDAGMSEHQQLQAVRLANVPEEQFQSSIESEKPPTISQLAIMARDANRPLPKQRPAGFQAATNLIGTVEEFARFCAKENPETIANAVMAHEVGDLRKHVATIDAWLDRFVTNLQG